MTEKHKDDAMLEEYLDGKSKLSVEYAKHDKHQPSPELDQLILAEAKNAVSSREKKSNRGRNSWLVPASIAATVILSFSLIQLQKPAIFNPQENERDMANVAEDAVPEKKQLAKKEKARIKPDFKTPAPVEEQLATAPAINQAPATASVASGFVMESEPRLARKKLEKQRTASLADATTELSQPQWLEKIRRLLKEQKVSEAKKEYADFIKAYPSYVPDDKLKQQLGLVK